MSLEAAIRATAPVCYWMMQDTVHGIFDRDASTAGPDDLDFVTGHTTAAYRPLLAQPSIIPSRPNGYSVYFDEDAYANVSLDAGGGELRGECHFLFFIRLGADWPTMSVYRHNPRGATGFGRGCTVTFHGSADAVNHGIVQAIKGIGAAPWSHYLTSAVDVVLPNQTYMVITDFGSAGHMKIRVKEVIANNADLNVPAIAGAYWPSQAEVESTAPNYGDISPGDGHYPLPGQLYLNGTRTDVPIADPDGLRPNFLQGKFWMSDFVYWHREVSSAEASTIYEEAVTVPTAYGRRSRGCISHRRLRQRAAA